MAFGLESAQGDLALTLTAQGAGTVTSGPITSAGKAGHVLLMVHVSAITGTTPTLNTSLEQSADGSSWAALTGSATAQITTAVNAVAYAYPTANYVRVTATVGGTTPAVTARIATLVFGD
jgi:hypothetical protein